MIRDSSEERKEGGEVDTEAEVMRVINREILTRRPMNQQELLYRISQLLSRFTEQVKILNSNGEFSINIHAENILIDVLNVIFECNLKNVNYEENKIYPSIDLRDQSKRIAIQVTSTGNIEKIKHTLSGFVENGLYKDYDTLYIYIITEKQKSYKQSSIDDIIGKKLAFSPDSIIDKTDLYIKLNAMNDIQKIESICQLLEKQFADHQVYDKWDMYCKGLYEYDQYIVNLYSYLDIKGFSPRVNNTLVRLDIDKIYVPLKFKFDISNNDEELLSREKRNSYDTITALENYERIVVLGDPGSGKSTSLKYLAHTICSHRTDSNRQQSYVPVLIKATDFAKYNTDTGRSLSEYIIDFNTKYGLLFSKSLENNNLVLLLDGLDEINITNQRHVVVDKVNSFAAQYPEIKIIVSSRIVGYKETRLSYSFFHFEVEKFSDEQILMFLNNWYSSISSYSDKNQEKAFEEAKNLFQSIKQNSSVYKLACNPLLITIIALINYQGNKLPEKRASLYEISTTTLLDNWVKLRVNHKNNIDKEILIELLAIVAFHIHENNSTGLIPEKDLREILRCVYAKIYPHLPEKELRQDIRDIISFLREDAGFLFEKGYDEKGEALFGFVHLTFQEYFAAMEFNTKWKEGSLKNDLKSYIFNSSWTEVIKLAASLFKLNDPSRLGRNLATKFVLDIFNTDEIIPDAARCLYLVCQILKEDVEIEFDTLRVIIDDMFNRLLSKDNITTDDRITYIYDVCFNVLLSASCYRKYLLERIIERIESNTSPIISRRLIVILMGASDNQDVYDYLLSVLQSDQVENKIFMFEYNTVMPVAEIVMHPLFRTEMVKYVNSADFAQKYAENLPTQYCCCFNESLEDRLLSINLLADDRMKIDLINFYVFSWGISDVDNLRAYYEAVKKKYPSFDFSRIENRLSKLEKRSALGIDKYPILSFKDLEIFRIKGNDSSYALIYDEDISIVDGNFKTEDFEPYLGKTATSFIKFCDMVFIADHTESKEIIIHDDKELELLMAYSDTIHWIASIKLNNAKMYALSQLFVGGSVNDRVLHWLKSFHGFQRVIMLDKTFDTYAFEESVRSSLLDVFDKIILLKLVNPQFRDNEMFSLAIEEYNKIESVEKKRECRIILSDIF